MSLSSILGSVWMPPRLRPFLRMFFPFIQIQSPITPVMDLAVELGPAMGDLQNKQSFFLQNIIKYGLLFQGSHLSSKLSISRSFYYFLVLSFLPNIQVFLCVCILEQGQEPRVNLWCGLYPMKYKSSMRHRLNITIRHCCLRPHSLLATTVCCWLRPLTEACRAPFSCVCVSTITCCVLNLSVGPAPIPVCLIREQVPTVYGPVDVSRQYFSASLLHLTILLSPAISNYGIASLIGVIERTLKLDEAEITCPIVITNSQCLILCLCIC